MGLCEWFVNLKVKFGWGVLILIGFVNFMQGFKVFLALSIKDLFKHYMHLEPDEAQFFSSFLGLSWSMKLFYGLFVDNISLCGSHRKSYVRLNGVLMFCCLIPLTTKLLTHKYIVVLCLFLY